ncbi:MAG: PEP-CTERM sorting domain-containing protein [Fimbriimonadaceae bacterium]
MKTLTLIATGSLLALGASANAAIILTTVGGTISESFDGMGTTTVANQFSATIGAQSVATGSTFDGTKIAGTGTTATGLVANDGTGNSGGVYNYGNATGPVSDRALGAVASGSNTMAFGVVITNNTGAALDSITIDFTQENWRSSTSTNNVFNFEYSTASTAATYLTDTGFTSLASLNLVGPAFVTTNGALDGNLATNQAARSGVINFLTAPLANGQSVYLRWSDFNDVGNDAGLAIDNFNVTGQAVPEPATMAVLGLIAAAAARRKRK